MESIAEENDQVIQTHAYIKKHRLNELFAHFLQLLIYHKPENPRDFLKQEVHHMLETMTPTPLFGEQDLETMFDLIDVTRQRWVTVEQLRNTCRNLATAAGEGTMGLPSELEEAIERAGDEAGHVSVERFREVLSTQLFMTSMWAE